MLLEIKPELNEKMSEEFVENYIDGLVSVITPMYNSKDYIIDTIQSVLHQTYDMVEMIIVDDSSTDGSDELVETFLSKNSESVMKDSYSIRGKKVRLLQNESNAGIVFSRNRALKEAKGRYIAFLDSDDLWDADKLEKQIAFMTEQGVDFCYSACQVMDENGKPTGRIRVVPKEASYEALLKDNFIPCLTVVADRKRIPTEHLLMPHIRHEDYAAWLNVLRPYPTIVRNDEMTEDDNRTNRITTIEKRSDGITADRIRAAGLTEVLASYRVNVSSASGNKLKAAIWHWKVLLKQEKLPFIKSLKYMFYYATGVIKRYSQREENGQD